MYGVVHLDTTKFVQWQCCTTTVQNCELEKKFVCFALWQISVSGEMIITHTHCKHHPTWCKLLLLSSWLNLPKWIFCHKTWLILLSDALNNPQMCVTIHKQGVGDGKLAGNRDNNRWDQCMEASLCMTFWHDTIWLLMLNSCSLTWYFFNLNGTLVNRIYNNYIDSIHTTYKCLDQKTKQNLTSQMPLASVDISTITNGSTVDGSIQRKRCWGSSDTGIKVQFVNVYSTPPYSGWSSIRLDNA